MIKFGKAVISGRCTCMAGLGETCSHIGALLYWIGYQVQRYVALTSTLRPNEWLQPQTTKQVPTLRLDVINFTSVEESIRMHKLQTLLLDQPSFATNDHDQSAVQSSQCDKPSTSGLVTNF